MASPSCKWQECQTLSQTPWAPSLTPSLGTQAHEVQLLEHQAPPPTSNLDPLPLHPEHGSRCIMNRQLSCFFFLGGGCSERWDEALGLELFPHSGCPTFWVFFGVCRRCFFFLSNYQDKTRTFGAHDAQRRTMIAEVLPSIEELGLTQDCNMGKIRPRKQHLSNIFLAIFLCLIRTATCICYLPCNASTWAIQADLAGHLNQIQHILDLHPVRLGNALLHLQHQGGHNRNNQRWRFCFAQKIEPNICVYICIYMYICIHKCQTESMVPNHHTMCSQSQNRSRSWASSPSSQRHGNYTMV